MPPLPSGTVTFLFTDIEGSTRLWEAHPDAMRDAVARHDAMLRTAIESHGGHVVKTTGDGAMAAFAGASDATDAAVAAQRAIHAEAWPLPAPLRVRMGIHAGLVESHDGDYHGTAVNRAARIMAVAHGGQVVISGAAYELLRDTRAELVDLGSHRLKDLSEPERIFQVADTDLDRDFPPLRSLDASTTNLPAQRTSFVGRERELGAVKEAMAGGRLVTLTGVGGVGKTRLAVQVAAELVGEFPDGVWLVELDAVGDPDAVPDVVAGTLGLVPQPGRTTTESIADVLAGRQTLLVLDNCEHVLDAVAALLDVVLARPGPAKVLATSREGLRLDDERLWPVPSMSSRDGEDTAVELFVERARAAVPDFDVEAPGTAIAVQEICRRLDGIPLAIELAAARTISMGVPELRDRLDDRFRLLSGARRGLERHQTLRHAVQWSYDLLDDAERALLDRSAMFAGGFDLAAAIAVAAGDGNLDEYAVLDVLDALVRKSLLIADTSSGRTRYRMLETIRQFAEEQLAERGELPEFAGRHARYYAATVNDVIMWWGDERALLLFTWIRVELANLRTAFRTAADAADLDTAATIAVSASAAGCMAGVLEPVSWTHELLAAATDVDHPKLASLEAAASMSFSLDTDRRDDAMHAAESARARLDDPKYEVLPFGYQVTLVASVYNYVGRPDLWVEFQQAALARIPESDVSLRTSMAMGLAFAGRPDEAAAFAVGLVEDAEQTRSLPQLLGALQGYGIALFDQDPQASLAAMRRAGEEAEPLGISAGHISALLCRAEAAHGDPRAALAACRDSLRGYAAEGNRAGSTTPLAVLATLLHRYGRDEPAAVVAGCGERAMFGMYPEVAASINGLRDTLGQDSFEALASRGQAMESAEMFRYAQEQIDTIMQALQHEPQPNAQPDPE